MSDLSDTASQVSAIRAMIARHKRWDVIFSMIGLVAMLLGVITLLALFLDLVLDGYGVAGVRLAGTADAHDDQHRKRGSL